MHSTRINIHMILMGRYKSKDNMIVYILDNLKLNESRIEKVIMRCN